MGTIASRLFSKKPKHAPAPPSAEDTRRVQEMERKAADDARKAAELEREACQERTYREQQRLLEEARRLQEEVEDRNREIEEMQKLHEQQKRDYKEYPLPDFLANGEYTVNICVTGNSGAGKSSLINTIRGLRASDPKAAKVGVCETTMKPTAYAFPANEQVRLWDLPGGGMLRFPAKRYVQQFGLRHFDVVIIAGNVRFTELDYKIMDNLRNFNVPFFVVRTKVDVDVTNEYHDKGRSESQTLEAIRMDARKNGIDELYFVNNRDAGAFDMPTLLRNLEAMIANRDSGFEQRELPSSGGAVDLLKPVFAKSNCPNCDLPILWSDFSGDKYAAGWTCDNVKYGTCYTCAGPGEPRWWCPSCHSDVCVKCIPYSDHNSSKPCPGVGTPCDRKLGFDEETVDTYDDGNISPRSIDTGVDTINTVNTTRSVRTINTLDTAQAFRQSFARRLPKLSEAGKYLPRMRRNGDAPSAF